MSHHIVETAATVTLNIDGMDVTVDRGTTILNAAKKLGVTIPTLCYLKKLNPIGSCRICSVEVEGSKSPIMSCVTPVVEGMKVTTSSEKLAAYRRQMMRFILTNHPLDCPVCERSGECLLQNRTFDLEVTGHNFATEGYAKTPVADWNVIRYDRNLCIFCERCVKVCIEVQGLNALRIDGNGYQARIAPNAGDKLDCDFCGQCLSVCPVGALSSGIIFAARSWEVKKTKSVCPHCAVGCSVEINTKSGKVIRVTASDCAGVNSGNLCARGRFGHESYLAPGRLESPMIRENDRLAPASWGDAIDHIADKVHKIKALYGPESVALIIGETLSNEDAYLAQKLFRTVIGSNRIDTLSNMLDADLNSELFEKFGGAAPIVDYAEIKNAGSYFLFACDAEKENPVIGNIMRVTMRDRGIPMFAANMRSTHFEPREMALAQYAAGTETTLLSALIRVAMDGDGKDIDLESAVKITGVPEDKIVAIAKGLRKAGSPVILLGTEILHHPKSAEIVKGAIKLATALGGKVLLYREYCNSQGVNDMGASPHYLPGYMKVEDTDGRVYYTEKWKADVHAFKHHDENILKGLHDGKVKAVVILGADPITQYPDGEYVRAAISSAEFVVASASYPNETTKIASVTLPSCTAAERSGTYTNNEGRPQYFAQAVKPVGHAKPEWMMIRDIAGALGVSWHYGSAEAVTDEIADTVPAYEGLTTKIIAEGNKRATYPAGEKEMLMEFDSNPVEIPVHESFPYVAVIGNSLYHLGLLTRNSAMLNSIVSGAYVEMAKRDAAAGGFADGDMVVVGSKHASIKATLSVSDRAAPGVVFISKNFENQPALSLIHRNDEFTKVRIGKA